MIKPASEIRYCVRGVRAIYSTKDEVSAEPQHHLRDGEHQVVTFLLILLTVFRRPNGLHRKAPIMTPGSAIAPRSSWNSAVLLMSPSWIMLAMIVPENTPFGKVICGIQLIVVIERIESPTKSYKNLSCYPARNKYAIT